MSEYYNIKEVAKLLQIPTSTLRYWDEEGIIHAERDRLNNYRRFSLGAVMELSTVSFYRSLGIPVKEVKQMMESEVKIQKSILEEEEEKVERQIQKMYEQRQRIWQQKALLEEIERLKTPRFCLGNPAFRVAVSFERENKRHWESMMSNLEQFVLILDVDNCKKITYAIGVEKEKKGEKVLWKREDAAIYAECLLKTQNNEEGKNNLEECLELVRKAGRRPLEAAAQYLTSEWRGELIDYYKLWLRLEP